METNTAPLQLQTPSTRCQPRNAMLCSLRSPDPRPPSSCFIELACQQALDQYYRRFVVRFMVVIELYWRRFVYRGGRNITNSWAIRRQLLRVFFHLLCFLLSEGALYAQSAFAFLSTARRRRPKLPTRAPPSGIAIPAAIDVTLLALLFPDVDAVTVTMVTELLALWCLRSEASNVPFSFTDP